MHVTQKGSPNRTPGGGDGNAGVYTILNIQVFPNVGLCGQRFSWIDGIQVIARLVGWFFSQRAQAVLWGEPASC